MSGGRATIGLSSGAVRGAQAGDVSAIASVGELLLDHVVVECKCYRDLELFSGIVNGRGHLYKFWHDLGEASARYGKRPMLIARQNNMPTVCLVTSQSASVLFHLSHDHAMAVLPGWDCHVVLFDCFLREASVPDGTIALVDRPRRVRLA